MKHDELMIVISISNLKMWNKTTMESCSCYISIFCAISSFSYAFCFEKDKVTLAACLTTCLSRSVMCLSKKRRPQQPHCVAWDICQLFQLIVWWRLAGHKTLDWCTVRRPTCISWQPTISLSWDGTRGGDSLFGSSNPQGLPTQA